MLARAAAPPLLATFAGFVLLLIVTLSVTSIKRFSLLRIDYSDGDLAATLGVFRACYFNHDGVLSSCTKEAVGYMLDPVFFGKTTSDFGKVLSKGLIGSLVLNPIAAGLAGISLFFAFFAWLASSRFLEIVTFLIVTLAGLCAWIAFWLDLALALVGKHRIKDHTHGAYDGHLGRAIWVALAGAIVLSIANCSAGVAMFGRYSQRNQGRGTY